ncbi:MAG: 4-(cytidine 5'-diphospho)-2-C-methyl-D-erythritol kinase [Pikeienuella sp.]
MQDKSDAARAPFAETARAKVNLFLHIRGQRPEGYHTLDSFVVFPGLGDRVEAAHGTGLSLSVSGPFGDGLGTGLDNLTLAAAAALSDRIATRPGAALRLEKNLPVAAGIGGGSADAGAALRLLARMWDDVPHGDLDDIAFALGADAPMCLAQRPAIIGGVGERLAPPPAFPGFWLVMINPMQPLSTAEVFGALTERNNPAGPPPPARFLDLGHLTSWLSTCRNDLEAPARALRPVIAQCLSALSWHRDCRFARMSGSGATCFGMFATEQEALGAAQEIRVNEPGWWVAAAPVDEWNGPE